MALSTTSLKYLPMLFPFFPSRQGGDVVPVFVHISLVEILDQPEFYLCNGARFPEIPAGFFISDIGTPDHLKRFLLIREQVKGGRSPLQNGVLIRSFINTLDRQLHIMSGKKPVLVAPCLSNTGEVAFCFLFPSWVYLCPAQRPAQSGRPVSSWIFSRNVCSGGVFVRNIRRISCEINRASGF